MIANHKENLQNRYANNVQSTPIYIDDAESGRKGYYCMGCTREMEAVKTKIVDRASYFRHYVKKNSPKNRCTYSDKTYRHKLAKENLLTNKRIKVPAVYKYSNNDSDPAIFIKPAKIIEAQTVHAKLSFYEDESGNIKWTKATDIDTEYLLYKPDITFFDKTDTPILFIDITTSHKPDKDKLVSLLRLGIDAVSVIIPKASPAEIDQVFEHSQNTKWLYNKDEINTEYIRVPNGNTKGISHIDKEQRQLFAESNRCRKAQINNLIRAIGKVLESQPYRDTESKFESEISRVEKNTEELQDRLFNEEASLREKLSTKLEGETRAVDDEIDEIQSRYANLEERYIRKREDLEGNGTELLGSIRNLQYEIRSISGSPEEREINHRKEADDIERKIGDIEINIDGVIADREASKRSYDEHIRQEKDKIRKDEECREGIPESSRRRILEMVDKYRKEEVKIVDNIKRSESTREGFAEQSKREEDELREEFETIDKSSAKAIENANFGENPYLSEQYEAMLSAERLVSDYIVYHSPFTRLTKIKEFINSGVFKNWV
ncbi:MULTISPECIES: hypothetical protein [unclassified Sphingobacterium]|uniref:hypothetical protein n=1 Tax=unclassified Sphingobacterium TaxID=2609468 RepID=UPI001044505E|nr:MULTISPECIES: hypothetical protein [unclassified Sphingobacterium]MCS3557403.1 flagellar motility protein MotE (MotC chaperone) [Sphingobacterium sp. JUb21]TCQ96700.1 hypothetical protein EDF66_12142 [Sphingobacterium sp. JUb20]